MSSHRSAADADNTLPWERRRRIITAERLCGIFRSDIDWKVPPQGREGSGEPSLSTDGLSDAEIRPQSPSAVPVERRADPGHISRAHRDQCIYGANHDTDISPWWFSSGNCRQHLSSTVRMEILWCMCSDDVSRYEPFRHQLLQLSLHSSLMSSTVQIMYNRLQDTSIVDVYYSTVISTV